MTRDPRCVLLTAAVERVLSRRGLLSEVTTGLAGIGLMHLLADGLAALPAGKTVAGWQPGRGGPTSRPGPVASFRSSAPALPRTSTSGTTSRSSTASTARRYPARRASCRSRARTATS